MLLYTTIVIHPYMVGGTILSFLKTEDRSRQLTCVVFVAIQFGGCVWRRAYRWQLKWVHCSRGYPCYKSTERQLQKIPDIWHCWTVGYQLFQIEAKELFRVTSFLGFPNVLHCLWQVALNLHSETTHIVIIRQSEAKWFSVDARGNVTPELSGRLQARV